MFQKLNYFEFGFEFAELLYIQNPFCAVGYCEEPIFFRYQGFNTWMTKDYGGIVYLRPLFSPLVPLKDLVSFLKYCCEVLRCGNWCDAMAHTMFQNLTAGAGSK
jgi:hypothetical protein